MDNLPPGFLCNAPKNESIYPLYSRQGLELNRDFMSILNSPITIIYVEGTKVNFELDLKNVCLNAAPYQCYDCGNI